MLYALSKSSNEDSRQYIKYNIDGFIALAPIMRFHQHKEASQMSQMIDQIPKIESALQKV